MRPRAILLLVIGTAFCSTAYAQDYKFHQRPDFYMVLGPRRGAENGKIAVVVESRVPLGLGLPVHVTQEEHGSRRDRKIRVVFRTIFLF